MRVASNRVEKTRTLVSSAGLLGPLHPSPLRRLADAFSLELCRLRRGLRLDLRHGSHALLPTGLGIGPPIRFTLPKLDPGLAFPVRPPRLKRLDPSDEKVLRRTELNQLPKLSA